MFTASRPGRARPPLASASVRRAHWREWEWDGHSFIGGQLSLPSPLSLSLSLSPLGRGRGSQFTNALRTL